MTFKYFLNTLNVYKKLIRPFLFLFPPEAIHKFAVLSLKVLYKIPGMRLLLRRYYEVKAPVLTREVAGLMFDNPVGLAAGFDKDAELVDELAGLGFGFIEIGTVTPEPQPGNRKPRLFRLKTDRALINRMGFNNRGMRFARENLEKRKSHIIIGGNIGKNKATDNRDALDDYLKCLNELYDVVDYFAVNVSSPNTPDLRQLQEKQPLMNLLGNLMAEIEKKAVKKPLFLKIAPDLTEGQLADIVDIVNQLKLAGVVATNTTIARDGLKTSSRVINKIGDGGLSGKPLIERSTEIIRYLRKNLDPDIHVIGVGGIMNPADAINKLEAGASLVQIYTGFIYEGPGIARAVNKALLKQ